MKVHIAWLRIVAVHFSTLLLVVLVAGCARGQRVDPHFRAILPNPATYPADQGPEVWIDEAHFNIVNLTGRYRPMIAVLRADGYRIRPHRSRFTPDTLRPVKLLIIGNPLPGPEDKTMSAPSQPAFDATEIRAVLNWVREGGSLLLLLDHMPIAGAGADLARSFGFEFSDGFVINLETWEPTVFRRTDGTLFDHPVTHGRNAGERVSTAAAFYGAAFRAGNSQPILVVPPSFDSFLPKIPWQVKKETPRINVAGWSMGASQTLGRGKVLVFGDATMFSAQIQADGDLMGLNALPGRQNLQLLLNSLHWLDGTLDSQTVELNLEK